MLEARDNLRDEVDGISLSMSVLSEVLDLLRELHDVMQMPSIPAALKRAMWDKVRRNIQPLRAEILSSEQILAAAKSELEELEAEITDARL